MLLRIIGISCIALAAHTADAAQLDLSPYRGKVIYLDFWASWCGPCRQSFPWMSDLQSRYASRNFVVLAVNLDHDRDSALRFLNDVPANFSIMYDPVGELATTYQVKGMPSAVLIDRNGHVRFRHEGFSPKKEQQYEEHLQTLLTEAAP